MINKKIVRSGFRVLKRFKLRSFFMMLGIIIGISALTLIISLGKGTKNQLINKVERLFSSNNILITSGGGEIKGGASNGGPTTTLTLDDILELKKQISNIEDFDAHQIALSRSVKYKQNNRQIPIVGSTPAGEYVWNRSVSQGSYFTEADMKRSARVAMIGTVVKNKLFGCSDPIGEQIRIDNIPFKVIGILEPMGIDPHGTNRDDEIIIPLTTVMRRVMNVDYIMSAKLLLSDESQMKNTVIQIREILRNRHHIDFDDPDDFTLLTPEKVQQIIAGMTNIFSILLPLISAVSLLTGGIVVATLMFITVNERRTEIGLRKAIGAKTKDIMQQFIIETTFITFWGGMFGFLIGTLGVMGLVIKMKLPLIVPWEAFFIGMISSVFVGLAAGILPAKRAASLDPVDIL